MPAPSPHRSLCILLLAALAFASGTAKAETWLSVSGASWHFDRDTRFCETNLGLGIEYRPNNSELAYVAGHFHNSYCKPTTYLGALWQPLRHGALHAGVWATAATGYPSPVLVLPAVSLRFSRVAVNFVAAPTIGNFSGFVAAQAAFRLDW